ncbi:hypothetical protein BRADI_2g18137v3 [Brachypodium distachyon]|uniref:Uncharacterized protein n=1 Tax=Brachypodium distachyon TaxID=15368 RepID=A0A0Q3K2Y2_BRADI|nr:hypothetical protein BRADI_2g18137v3 [Brachypodium distachyon]
MRLNFVWASRGSGIRRIPGGTATNWLVGCLPRRNSMRQASTFKRMLGGGGLVDSQIRAPRCEANQPQFCTGSTRFRLFREIFLTIDTFIFGQI